MVQINSYLHLLTAIYWQHIGNALATKIYYEPDIQPTSSGQTAIALITTNLFYSRKFKLASFFFFWNIADLLALGCSLSTVESNAVKLQIQKILHILLPQLVFLPTR